MFSHPITAFAHLSETLKTKRADAKEEKRKAREAKAKEPKKDAGGEDSDA